jgi:ubiquinone/menaquinone biosynthesis C-methylase UbiE
MQSLLTDRERQTIEYYDRYAEEWAQRRKKTTEPSFWNEELRELNRLKVPEGKILELGSGSGREALELIEMGYEYTGVDVSQELLKIARKRSPFSQFLHTTAYHLPFAPETFDAFFSWAMLPHIPKHRIDEALSSLKRVLKPGAMGFIAMREGEGEKQEKETGRWFSYYQQEEFEKILQKNGFKMELKNKKPSRADLVWLTFFVSMIKC